MSRIVLDAANGFFAFLLTSCVGAAASEGKTSASHQCALGEGCEISGILDYSKMNQGDLFELAVTAGEDKYDICVAVDGLSEKELMSFRGKNIVLSGRFEPFTESENCAFIKYGQSWIPCGYCGNRVFVATEITK